MSLTLSIACTNSVSIASRNGSKSETVVLCAIQKLIPSTMTLLKRTRTKSGRLTVVNENHPMTSAKMPQLKLRVNKTEIKQTFHQTGEVKRGEELLGTDFIREMMNGEHQQNIAVAQKITQTEDQIKDRSNEDTTKFYCNVM